MGICLAACLLYIICQNLDVSASVPFFVLVISDHQCQNYHVCDNALGHLHANDGVDEEEHGDQEDDVGECLE